MFDMHDDEDKVYKLKYSESGDIDTITAQSLYEFFMLEEHKITGTFNELKNRLDNGETVYAQQWAWDWNSSTHAYKGAIVLSKIGVNPLLKKPGIKTTGCRHTNKYVNSAGGTRFWFCRDCKKDLGNA